jgi:rhodanese-related sulfurtransferase
MIKQTLFTVLLSLCAWTLHAEVVNIDNAELTRLLAAGAAVIDVRTEPEWKGTGVLAGSKLLTFFDEKGQVDAPAWLAQLKTATKPGQSVILICRSGNRSRTAAQFLTQQAGYKTVYNVTAGMNGWASEGRAVVPAKAVMASCAPGAKC